MTPSQEARLIRAIDEITELIEQRKQATAHRPELAPPPGPYRALTNARAPVGGWQPPAPTKERRA